MTVLDVFTKQIKDVAAPHPSLIMKKRKPRLGRPRIPGKYSKLRKLREGEHFLNVRLTDDESRDLHDVAKCRGGEVRRMIYPLVLHWLQACADPVDLPVVMDPASTVTDVYWGTAREVHEDSHKLPAGRSRSTNERPKSTQQFVSEEALLHLRGLEKYYRASLNDLAASSIAWALANPNQ